MTDEERERIYEEEKARADARLKLEQEKKLEEEKKKAAAALATRKARGCATVGCLGLLLLFILLAAFGPKYKYTDEYGIDKRDPDYKALRHFVDGK